MVLKTFYKLLFLIFLFIANLHSVTAQQYHLTLTSKDSVSRNYLGTLKYRAFHKSKKSVFNEIDSISLKLAYAGFVNNDYRVTEIDSIFKCVFTLNNRIDSIKIFYHKKIPNTLLTEISNSYTSNFFTITTSEIENTLNNIITYYENNGYSFVNASLKKLHIQNNTLSASLALNISNKRKIDNVVIKGYAGFPEKYISHYLDIKKGDLFNLNTLERVEGLIRAIPFVTQIKSPEVLFTKDSTSLFLYLKKKSDSKFDGIIGFSNQANNNTLKFNGYLNLFLNNIFNKAETISFNWRNNTQDSNQSLKLNFSTPYMMNSRFGVTANFAIFKQDSTYLNTSLNVKTTYDINRKNSIAVVINSEKSDLTNNLDVTDNIGQFDKRFIGLSYRYKTTPNYLNSESKFFVNAHYLFGNKTSVIGKTKQQKFLLQTQLLININNNLLRLKNSTELLNTKNLLQNELFRIGGINSIRGFDEQSVFTSKYNLTNIEYHFNSGKTSHIYTITDFAILKNDLKNTTDNLYGFGVGYYFTTNYSLVNISYVLGKNDRDPVQFNNSKIHIKITYFL